MNQTQILQFILDPFFHMEAPTNRVAHEPLVHKVKVDTQSLERCPLQIVNGCQLSRVREQPWGCDPLRDGRPIAGVCLPALHNSILGLYCHQLTYKGSFAARGFDDRRAKFPRQPVPVCNRILKCRVGAGQMQTRRTTATAPTVEVFPDRHGYRHAVNLGTNWEQYWRCQPNATTISEEQVSIVTGLQRKTLSIAATYFQYHEYGRRAGLKIRFVCHQVDRPPGRAASRARGIPEGHRGGSRHGIASPRQSAAADPAQAGEDLLKPGSGGFNGSCRGVVVLYAELLPQCVARRRVQVVEDIPGKIIPLIPENPRRGSGYGRRSRRRCPR